jgi:hypothetical protein
MDLASFLDTWLGSAGAERANKDSFLKDLCDVLGVEHPTPATHDPKRDRYVFERDVFIPLPGQKGTSGYVDLYKEGCFLLEAKQGSDEGGTRVGIGRRGTPRWEMAMMEARGQALGYARTFLEPPPFLVVADLGYCFDLYACFDGTGTYRPFLVGRSNRIFLADLATHVDLLRAIWANPAELDPSSRAARVTEEVAVHLADLSRSLQLDSGNPPEVVARFLMRCVFTMFAEDVGLLQDDLFTRSLESHWLPNPASFPAGAMELWSTMDRGGSFGPFGLVRRFNGGLFTRHEPPPRLSAEQLRSLLDAARKDWRHVEPAIFGTLFEDALKERDRHVLGAHYTPRAYVERLVKPTVEEPVREEWEAAQAEVRELVASNQPHDLGAARLRIADFHQRLTSIRVLDPACGSGNFLYVAMDSFLRLEDEVAARFASLGGDRDALLGARRVKPAQFLGLEINEWAKQVADVVLWIGYYQWLYRTGQAVADGRVEPGTSEPVLENPGNIQVRDAVLDCDFMELAKSASTRRPVVSKRRAARKYDGEVRQEHERVSYHYHNPRPAEWPEAEFIVGNPPFIGKAFRRDTPGDDYLDALHQAWPAVPKGVDYVMYWWHRAARLVLDGKAKRFGFITTNSLRQSLNRRVVETALKSSPGYGLLFAVPDHPWVDSDSGAAVRISMTTFGALQHARPRLTEVKTEKRQGEREVKVTLQERSVERLNADLRAGVDLGVAKPLRANEGMCSVGLVLFGQGFVVSAEEAQQFEPEVCHPFLNGRDLMQSSRGSWVLDLFPYDLDEARARFPKAFQRIYDTVRPERALIRDTGSRTRWWRFGRDKPELRAALAPLSRYIATVEVSKHRVFQFVSSATRPDHTLIAFASKDAYLLGVLSSRAHVCWSLAAGGSLEDRPRYNRSVCFDPFPFPLATQEQEAAIRKLAEAIDAHRKARLAEHPELTVTGLYNVLELLRQGKAPTGKDAEIRRDGLVSVLMSLHDDLDAAVFDAYGWPHDLDDEQILERVVALNAERAREESDGLVRWLRPDARPNGATPPDQDGEAQSDIFTPSPREVGVDHGPLAWPTGMQERLGAVQACVFSQSKSWTLEEVRADFKGAPADQVEEVLRSLAFLGNLVQLETEAGVRWRGAARPMVT